MCRPELGWDERGKWNGYFGRLLSFAFFELDIYGGWVAGSAGDFAVYS